MKEGAAPKRERDRKASFARAIAAIALFDYGWVLVTRRGVVELHHNQPTGAYDASMVVLGSRQQAAKVAKLLSEALS